MNFEEELSRMVNEMMARSGQSPGRIICNQETLDQLWEQTRMIYVSNDDIENNTGYVARFNGIPITVSSQIEPGKFFVLPDTSETRPIRVRFEDSAEPINTMHYRGITDPARTEGVYSEGDIVTHGGRNFVWHDNGFVEIDTPSVESDTLTFAYNHTDEDGVTYTHHYQDGIVDTSPWWSRSPYSAAAGEPIRIDNGTLYIDGEELAHGRIGFDTSQTPSYTATFNYTPPEVEFEMSPDTERLLDKIKNGRVLKRKKKAEEEQVEINEKSFFDILADDT